MEESANLETVTMSSRKPIFFIKANSSLISWKGAGGNCAPASKLYCYSALRWNKVFFFFFVFFCLQHACLHRSLRTCGSQYLIDGLVDDVVAGDLRLGGELLGLELSLEAA
jgi:hypothetical protein